ncbi:MAG: hypothetical protein A2X25_08740 [Chloroflexi bacterium GWB2_49_20]|nr:MAG: hypothetical protein A2X25_08740 [Chloroflexi bacterium GWB2_49_20]OGN79480.1 MAG: hypothetical protein A2X26_05285 [Chloroflexi bacterium GWC2_49_37]OGN84597.1 MAG: hypothetical protein A2X27_11245 [Chloroflexi bacterium GWD2_49_16]HCC79293.1 hypothetical protein [Anaerolineae bacterium]HCM97221.1 hypothetical protein [Anaerolineae bacterium]
MKQQTLQADANSHIQVQFVAGDLRVAGWERAEIMAKTNGDSLDIEATEQNFVISCDDDLILYLPRQVYLMIENVAGDASLQALKGQIKLGSLNGDLSLNDVQNASLDTASGDVTLRNVGRIMLGKIDGDLNLHNCQGDFSAVSINGDASLRDVEGNVSLEKVEGDLYLRNVRGSVHADVGNDAALNLDPLPGVEYCVSAGEDLLLHLPVDANAELHLAIMDGDEGSLHVDFPGVTLEEGSPTQKFALGNGSAKMYLTAGEDLIVTSKSEKWDSAADFGVGMLDGLGIPSIPTIPPIPPIPHDLGGLNERINLKVQKALEKVQLRSEGLSRRADVRVEAAMRRAESKARAAEVRARRGHDRHVNARINIGGTEMFSFSSNKKPVEPVSDDERLTILRMLQEKKISAVEAEKLLSALEGQGE